MSLATAAGCAATEPPEPEPGAQNNAFVGDEPVFAVLRQQADGEWSFGQVTRHNEEPEHGFLVRLNDLAPAFDTRPAECGGTRYPPWTIEALNPKGGRTCTVESRCCSEH